MMIPNMPGRVSYHHALGRFVDRFAKVEGAVKELLYCTANLDPKIGRILLNGERIDGSKRLIKALRDENGVPPDEWLDRAFAQLTLITKARNHVLHNEPEPKGATEFVTVSNARSTKPGNEETITFSPEIFEAMITDLWTISFAVQNAISPGEGSPDRAQQPWQYTPVPQAPRPKRTPPTDQQR